ncbi:unnamed protein product [Calypogeia fissa]
MKSTGGTIPLAAVLLLLLCSCCNVGFLSVAADPDPLVDVSPKAHGTFILRDIFTNGEVTNGTGGIRAALNTSIYPVLTSEGITFVQFKMKPCGENLPHSHPRATEIVTLVSGGPLQVGVVTTEPEAYIYIMHPGDVMVFPRGLLHFELNVGGEEAFYISALNSQNPGVLTAQQAYFQLPLRAAAGGLNQSFKTTEKLQDDHPTSAALQLISKKMGCVPNKDITTEI